MQRLSRVDVPEPMRRALPKATDGRPIDDLPRPQPAHGAGALLRGVDEGAPREGAGRAQDGGDRRARPFTAVFFTNHSWHWDGQNPAGNPIQIATLSHSAQASLARNEVDLLAEALFQYGDVPSGTPWEGEDRRLPLVCSYSPSYPRATMKCCFRVAAVDQAASSVLSA
jgi:hypothetical protein